MSASAGTLRAIIPRLNHFDRMPEGQHIPARTGDRDGKPQPAGFRRGDVHIHSGCPFVINQRLQRLFGILAGQRAGLRRILRAGQFVQARPHLRVSPVSALADAQTQPDRVMQVGTAFSGVIAGGVIDIGFHSGQNAAGAVRQEGTGVKRLSPGRECPGGGYAFLGRPDGPSGVSWICVPICTPLMVTATEVMVPPVWLILPSNEAVTPPSPPFMAIPPLPLISPCAVSFFEVLSSGVVNAADSEALIFMRLQSSSQSSQVTAMIRLRFRTMLAPSSV